MKRLGLDIETEGILHSGKQSYFHPRKVEVFDGVPRKDIIQTVALGWREHGQKWGCVLRWKDHRDRAYLLRVLRKAKDKGWWFVGANLSYDILFMRYCDDEIRLALTPFMLKLRDVLIVNYLAYDQRPERSLKTLSHLFGITEYELDQTYPNDMAPDLHRYNLQDVFATLELDDLLCDQIRAHFGADSEKLSAWSNEWFSDILWVLIHKQEVGIKMDPEKVQHLNQRCSEWVAWLNHAALKMWNTPFFGKDSQKTTDRLFVALASELGLSNHPDLEITKETKKISTGKSNGKMFLEKATEIYVDPQTPRSRQVWAKRVIRRLRLITKVKTLWKTASTYTRPMMQPVKRKKRLDDQSCQLIDGFCYPQWYPIPMGTKDDKGDEGGTVQVRFAAKDPACQTWQKAMKACMTSRFMGGYLVEADQSQMELRMPALRSGDKVMMAVFEKGGDFHGNMIARLMGEEIRELPKEEWDQLRQAGKEFNFGTIFGAAAFKLMIQLRKKVGLTWPLEQVEEARLWFLDQFKRLKEWQEEQLALAEKQEYLTVPFTGHSRTFSGGGDVVRSTYYTNIRNFPVQGPSAAVVQSAEIEITKARYRHHLLSCVPLNCHDSISIDVHPQERTKVQSLIDKCMPNPPYYRKLCRELGRSVPLVHESDWRGPFHV